MSGHSGDSLSADQQDRIWDHYQNADSGSFAASQPRLSYLARSIAPGSRVLNIGIGGGLFEQAAAERALDLHVLDPNEKSIAAARERFGLGDKAKAGYSQSIPWPEGHFDAVVASELLEHLTDEVLAQTVDEFARVLRPGGKLLGTVPARENLAENSTFCPHCRRSFHRWGHEQSFTAERMRSVLGQHLVVDRVFEKQFVCWPQLNWRGKLLAAGRLVFDPLVSSGKNLVFAAHRADS